MAAEHVIREPDQVGNLRFVGDECDAVAKPVSHAACVVGMVAPAVGDESLEIHRLPSRCVESRHLTTAWRDRRGTWGGMPAPCVARRIA
jgi:hypothetical protein